MECLVCGSDELRGRVVLAYEAPLAARGGGIRVGGLKVGQLDVREAWQALARRPVRCLGCGAKYVWVVAESQLVLVDDWEPAEPAGPPEGRIECQ